MTRFKPAALFILCLAVVFLPACLAQPHPVKNIFGLLVEEPPETPVKNPNSRRTLLVGTVSAAAGFENRALVYRVGPERFETDFYNEFLAPPSRLLADQTSQYLDGRNSRYRVVKTPGLVMAQFGLETYLESIYGDFTVDPPEAVLNIRFALNDLRGRWPRVMLDKTYRQAVAFEKDGPTALAAALNEALKLILADLNRDVENAR